MRRRSHRQLHSCRLRVARELRTKLTLGPDVFSIPSVSFLTRLFRIAPENAPVRRIVSRRASANTDRAVVRGREKPDRPDRWSEWPPLFQVRGSYQPLPW